MDTIITSMDARTRLTTRDKDVLQGAGTNYLCAVLRWNEANQETRDFIQNLLDKRYKRTRINS